MKNRLLLNTVVALSLMPACNTNNQSFAALAEYVSTQAETNDSRHHRFRALAAAEIADVCSRVHLNPDGTLVYSGKPDDKKSIEESLRADGFKVFSPGNDPREIGVGVPTVVIEDHPTGSDKAYMEMEAFIVRVRA